jgi:hypothetical protein
MYRFQRVKVYISVGELVLLSSLNLFSLLTIFFNQRADELSWDKTLTRLGKLTSYLARLVSSSN